MSVHETYKDIDLSGRKWRLFKFDPLTGSWVAFQVLTNFLPFGLDEKISVGKLPAGRPTMSKEAFFELQKDCLRFAHERPIVQGQEAPPIPVMLPDGRWGVGGLENDTATVLMITIQVLVYNISSFFDHMGGIMKGLGLKIPGLNLSPFDQSGKDTPTRP